MTADADKLRADLTRDEDRRSKVYDDADGVPLQPGLIVRGKATIGIGRNLVDRGLSDDEIDLLFANDVGRFAAELDQHLPWWRNLDEVRARALLNMAFNLGVVEDDGKLLQFKRLLASLQTGTFDDAMADETRKTTWAKQVGLRAERVIHMFLTGTDP